jgi:hypothetical protein
MEGALDKHVKAHTELQQAVHELIDVIEMMEALVVTDPATRSSLTRKLTRSKMLLTEARQAMRTSRLGEQVLPRNGSRV